MDLAAFGEGDLGGADAESDRCVDLEQSELLTLGAQFAIVGGRGWAGDEGEDFAGDRSLEATEDLLGVLP